MTEQKRLAPELEAIIGRRLSGAPFKPQSIADDLLRVVRLTTKYSREMMYWCIVSALTRYDFDCVRRYVRDWAASPVEPDVWDVSKWIPGDHYHVQGERFDTLGEAQEYIRRSGAVFGRLRERFVYKDGN